MSSVMVECHHPKTIFASSKGSNGNVYMYILYLSHFFEVVQSQKIANPVVTKELDIRVSRCPFPDPHMH